MKELDAVLKSSPSKRFNDMMQETHLSSIREQVRKGIRRNTSNRSSKVRESHDFETPIKNLGTTVGTTSCAHLNVSGEKRYNFNKLSRVISEGVRELILRKKRANTKNDSI